MKRTRAILAAAIVLALPLGALTPDHEPTSEGGPPLPLVSPGLAGSRRGPLDPGLPRELEGPGHTGGRRRGPPPGPPNNGGPPAPPPPAHPPHPGPYRATI